MLVVSAYDVNTAWAVGTYSDTNSNLHDLIEYWNGSNWSLQTGANPSSYGNILRGVKAFSATNVWAVGSSYNGITFDKGSGNGWAVGATDNSSGGENTLIEKYTPTQPSIMVSPTQGQLGTAITVTGSGWAPGDVVDISLSTSVSVLTKATVAGDGTFSTTFTVPGNATTGTQFVNAKDETTGQTARAPFTVTRPFNSPVNNLTTDATTTQSETTVAVSSVNSPGLTVMVGYNDTSDYQDTGDTGYSYSFDGGSSWTDAGALPVYKDSSGHLGYNGGDPAITVDNQGTFYFAQVAYTYQRTEEFILVKIT